MSEKRGTRFRSRWAQEADLATTLPLTVRCGPSFRAAVWLATVFLGIGLVVAVVFLVQPPPGHELAALVGGGIAAVVILAGVAWLRPWSRSRYGRGRNPVLIITADYLQLQRSPTDVTQIARCDVQAVVIYQAWQSFRKRGYTRITVHGGHGTRFLSFGGQWHHSWPPPNWLFDALGLAGYPAALRTALPRRRYRNALAPEWATDLLVPDSQPDDDAGDVPVTTPSRSGQTDSRVRVVDPARGASLLTFSRRRPVASRRLRVAFLGALFLGAAVLAPVMITSGVRDALTAAEQHRLDANGVRVLGTVTAVKEDKMGCGRSGGCTWTYDIEYRYPVLRSDISRGVIRYEGHTTVLTTSSGRYERGSQIPVVYDRSDVTTSYSPDAKVRTTDTVAKLVFGGLSGLAAIAMALIFVVRKRRAPTTR